MDKQHVFDGQRRKKDKRVPQLLAKDLPAMGLIAFPLTVFILGHLLLDWIGIPFAAHVLQAAGSIETGTNPNEAIADGLIWAATTHLYLLV